MQKLVRFRKAFYEKENDYQHNNRRKEGSTKPDLKIYLSLPRSNHEMIPCLEKEREEQKDNITANYYHQYGSELLERSQYDYTPPAFLARHQIDGMLRARMLDWMIEVVSSYKFTNKSYFDGVFLMDRYFNNEFQPVTPSKLHIIGVQCMTLASKMQEVYPLKMKTVQQKIAHKKFSVQELVDMEFRIINILDFKLNSWSFFDLVTLKLSQYAFQEPDQTRKVLGQLYVKNSSRKNIDRKIRYDKRENQIRKIEDVCSYLGKLALYDYEFYCETTMLMLAQTILNTAFDAMSIVTPQNFFVSSPILMELCKQKLLKIVKHYRQWFNGLNNIFKFTSKEVVTLIEQLLTY